MFGLCPTQGCEQSRRMMPKHFTNGPALNKYREDNEEDDKTDGKDKDDNVDGDSCVCT